MPLKKSPTKEAREENIARLIHDDGKRPDVAVAIAYDVQRRAQAIRDSRPAMPGGKSGGGKRC